MNLSVVDDSIPAGKDRHYLYNFMTNSRQILIKRLDKLQKHFEAIASFKALIDKIVDEKDVYTPNIYSSLEPQDKALFEAYLKRFASIQDYLGTKIFPYFWRWPG